MKRLDERRDQRRQGGESQDVVVVLPAKPGLREWWKKCKEVEGLTELHLEWVGEELKEVVRGGVKLVGGSIPNTGSRLQGWIRKRAQKGRGKGEGQGGGEGGGGGRGAK